MLERETSSLIFAPRAGKNEMDNGQTWNQYFLYQAILEQPDRVGRMLHSGRVTIERIADLAAAKKRIVFAGIGTSYHAALVAEHFLRFLTRGRARVRAEQPFELVNYPLALGPEDAVVVITHTGTTSYSLEALRTARSSGALAIALAGENPGEGAALADYVIQTCEQEISFAYTKSYTAALAALAIFSMRVAVRLGFNDGEAAAALENLPHLMRRALDSEASAREMAKKVAGRENLVLFGAGPNWATAAEVALKVKETSFLLAEGMETEQALHGPFSAIDTRTALVALLAGGKVDDRARTILEAAGEVGALRLAVAVSGAGRGAAAEHLIEVPAVGEWLTPFLLLVPLQFLSFFLAIERGANPDQGRQDQPTHDRARLKYKL